MSSPLRTFAVIVVAANFCLSGCQTADKSVSDKSEPGSRSQVASLPYLRDSSVVLNSKTVSILEITSNSVYGSGYDPKNAFDGMPAGNWTQWISGNDFRPFTRAATIQVRYAVPRTVIGYILLGRYESLKDRLPKDWILQGSNDSSGSASDPLCSTRWTTLDSASNMVTNDQWNSPVSYAGITRVISCPAAYSHYRLCVTAVNGSSVVDLIEIELLAHPDGQLSYPCDSAMNPPHFPDVTSNDSIKKPSR